MAKKKNQKSDTGFCVWIGPGIRGLIQHGVILPVPRERAREVLPVKVAALWDEGAGALTVGPAELPEARLAVKKEGSALWKISRNVARKLAAK